MVNRNFEDNYLHMGNRRRLVESLAVKGIKDSKVLKAIAEVPRHWFIDRAFESKAYLDKALPILAGQTISQPYTVAYQSSLLQCQPRQKVLEIGTGSGYQAAVLAKLGMRVFTLERQEELYRKTKELFAAHRFGSIKTFLHDGYSGLPAYAPFDRILVTAGAPKVPEALLEQLAISGIMVIPVGNQKQEMLRITRIDENQFKTETLGEFRFVPFAEGLVSVARK